MLGHQNILNPKSTKKMKLTVIIKVPAGLLYRVAVWWRIRRRWRRQIWGHTAHSHCFPMAMYRIWIKCTKLWMFWNSGSLKRIPIQIVPWVTWNAWSIWNGTNRHLGWNVRINVLIQFWIKVWSLQKCCCCSQMFVFRCWLTFLLLSDYLATKNKNSNQYKDSCYENDNSNYFC